MSRDSDCQTVSYADLLSGPQFFQILPGKTREAMRIQSTVPENDPSLLISKIEDGKIGGPVLLIRDAQTASFVSLLSCLAVSAP